MLKTINKIVDKTHTDLDMVNFRKATSVDKCCFVCKWADEIDGTCFCMVFKEFTPDMRLCDKYKRFEQCSMKN